MKIRSTANWLPTGAAAVVAVISVVAVVIVLGGAATGAIFGGQVYAVTPPPGPVNGAVGVEGTIPSAPPTQAATIGQPANGQGFTSTPVTVSGTCPKDTLVKIFSNGIFVGSVLCANGSYTTQVSLFSGRNDLLVRVFDALDQQGPDSNLITVTFTDAQFAQFESHVLITSQYARRAANPGDSLEWPVIVSGGIGPYAVAIDWGDGSAPELHSQPFADTFTYKHTYTTAGVYKVTYTVADGNGTNGYLQVVAVVTGAAGTNATNTKPNQGGTTTVTQTKILWWPVLLLLLLAVGAFWLGRRFELAALRKRLEQNF
jgi:hypothetical protein